MNTYDTIVKKFPNLFNRENFGFECGDGWFNIINTLCTAIGWYIAQTKKSNQWDIDHKSENIREVCPDVTIVQVKEKFGTLRFYYEGGNHYIRGMVRFAEDMSAVTCEECGNPGKLREGGWIRTLCDVHNEERIKRQVAHTS